jgi:carbon storage regulator CsrA
MTDKNGYLVLTRRDGESVQIQDQSSPDSPIIEITLIHYCGESPRLAISAPKHFKIMRSELLDMSDKK